jgi:hypothetical protein
MGKRGAIVLADQRSSPFLAGALLIIDPVLTVVPDRHFLTSKAGAPAPDLEK